jgi:hypothetical protein
LSVMLNHPPRAPAAVGAKVTAMVQLAPTATEEPQVLVWEKSPVVAIWVTFNAAVPLLVNVTCWAALLLPTTWLVKESDEGLNATLGAVACPLRRADCGGPVTLSVMLNHPPRVPAAVGAKVTAIMQLAPTATEEPQVLVWEKSPVAAIWVTFNAAVPLLVSVICWAALLLPTGWLEKLKLPGLNATLGAVACPLRLTDCGEPVALSVTLSLPPRAPAAVGAKVTAIMQLAPMATEEPQVLAWAKSPVAAIWVTFNAAVPLLVNVTCWAALLLPTTWLAKESDAGLNATLGTATSGEACELAPKPELPPTSRHQTKARAARCEPAGIISSSFEESELATTYISALACAE